MSSTYLNSRLRYNYFRFWTINVRHIWILPTVSFLTFHRNRLVVMSKSGQPLRKYDVISIFQDGCRGDLILFPVSCLLMSLSSEVQNISADCKPNFFDIAQFTAEPQLLPLWKNKRPPLWNFISGFDLNHFTVIGVLFCIELPNFVQIGPPIAEIWEYEKRGLWCCPSEQAMGQGEWPITQWPIWTVTHDPLHKSTQIQSYICQSVQSSQAAQ